MTSGSVSDHTASRGRGKASSGHTPPDGLLSTVVYRSQAVKKLAPEELEALVEGAHARNRAEDITGLLIYDDGHFLQWLEGPAEGVSRVLTSISRDRRHTDINILSERRSHRRAFRDRNLQLAATGRPVPNAVEPPPALLHIMHQRAAAAPALLAALAPTLVPTAPQAQAVADMPAPPGQQALQVGLLALIKARVIPDLVARHVPERTNAPPDQRITPESAEAEHLARLLIAADPAAAIALIDRICTAGPAAAAHATALFEPAARSLGDLWTADLCSEPEVTIGLMRMQMALRAMDHGPRRMASRDRPVPHVLVAPQPGERHMLSAVLDCEMLWQAGWDAEYNTPTSDTALQDMVADSWYDALDLSLSGAFRRDHFLSRMAETIHLARRASRNPDMVVVIGGRSVVELGRSDLAAAGMRGADAASHSALEIEQVIRRALPPV